MWYLVIALYETQHKEPRASPVFLSTELERVVNAAREAAQKNAYNMNGPHTGIYIFHVERDWFYEESDFLFSGDPHPDYPCLAFFHKEKGGWEEEWHHERMQKRFAKKKTTPPKAKKKRARKR